MSEIWVMPNVTSIQNTGTEWLLSLLLSIPDEQRVPTLMTIWRIWHAHNEVTHDKPCPTIEGSRRFLDSYLKSLMIIRQFPEADITKGKMVVDTQLGFKKAPGRDHPKPKEWWQPSEPGSFKLNVDGAFTNSAAGIGCVVRDHAGVVVLAACRKLEHCRDATDVELAALEEGIRLTLQWTNARFFVETDCAEAVQLIKDSTPNTSVYAGRVAAIRELLRERDSYVAKVSRELNCVSHGLAKLGRVHGRTELWLSNYPQEVADAVHHDCNSPSIYLLYY
jgi:hypothetical protein